MIARAVSLFVLLYAVGFVLFAFTLGKPAAADVQATDAAVVLTGGSGRIEHALDVLHDRKARRLLVAGADPAVTKADLAKRVPRSDALLKCCVDLGSESVDTRSNAEEAGRWLAKHHFHSLRLITSDWHMRRARYEFTRVLGGKYVLVTDGVRTEPGFLLLFAEYNKYLLRRVAVWADLLMALLRSLIYAALFYPGTTLFVLVGVAASWFGQRPTLAVVAGWLDFHHWLARHVLGIRLRVEGSIPPGPLLIAVKHQSMFETIEMARLAQLPIIVLKKELSDIPLFGFMTRRYGVIPVERSAGAKALRLLVSEGQKAIASGRPVIIYPEGTRVPVGQAPPLKSGFAALYRALGLPVIPVALDSGRLWGRGFVHRSGTVTIRIGATVPAGLSRHDVESRVHAAINALGSGAEPRA